MAGLISRKPVVGIFAGLLFGGLGVLLLGIESSGRVAAVLFRVSAWFFIFIGVVSFSSGTFALLFPRWSRKGR